MTFTGMSMVLPCSRMSSSLNPLPGQVSSPACKLLSSSLAVSVYVCLSLSLLLSQSVSVSVTLSLPQPVSVRSCVGNIRVYKAIAVAS